MAKIVSELHSVSLRMLSKEETTLTAKPTLYGFTLVEQYCDRHKVSDFFGPFSNLLGKVRTFVEMHCEDYEQKTFLPLIAKYEGFVTIKTLGKPLQRFINDHLDAKDVSLFTGLHMAMKFHESAQVDIQQDDLVDAFETIKSYADQIEDPRLRDAIKFDLDKLKVIMENAVELGHYEFWERYVEVSRLLTDILDASYGREKISIPAKLLHYVGTAKIVRRLAMGLPTLIGLGADATTLLDNVKKLA